MKNNLQQTIEDSDKNLNEPILNAWIVILTFVSLVDGLELILTVSEVLSITFLLSSISVIGLCTFKVRSTVTLISLFYIVLIIGSIKSLNLIYSSENIKELSSTFYSFFLSLGFLIIINNVNNRSFDKIITIDKGEYFT